MKRVLAIGGVLIIIVLAAQIAGYFVALNSDAYAAASRFVLSDAEISKKIGPISKARLAPFDAEIRFTANTGQAKFVVSADTASGIHKVLVQLEKTESGWQVTTSTILS